MGKQPKKHWISMQFVTASISTMMVLVLLGVVMFCVLSAQNLTDYVRENINFTLLLNSDAKEADMIALQRNLDKQHYVKQVIYISKEQALREQTEAMGSDPTDFLGYNPFTASLEIKLKSEFANADSLQWIEKELAKSKVVAEVVYPQALVESVNSNLGKVSLALLGMAGLLTLISFVLINNTIRLTIYSKRFLIHTMKLVGASWGFIRRPFLCRNLWVGIVAGVMADAALMGGTKLLLDYEPQLVTIITWELLGMVMAAVLLFGMVITTLCAWISINRYLRMRASTLYYI